MRLPEITQPLDAWNGAYLVPAITDACLEMKEVKQETHNLPASLPKVVAKPLLSIFSGVNYLLDQTQIAISCCHSIILLLPMTATQHGRDPTFSLKTNDERLTRALLQGHDQVQAIIVLNYHNPFRTIDKQCHDSLCTSICKLNVFLND